MRLLTVIILWGTASMVTAQVPDALQASAASPVSVSYSSPHYLVTSFAGEQAARQTADFLETLANRFSTTLQMTTPEKKPLAVVLYADKAAFDKEMGPLLGDAKSDFTALGFSDPDRARLVAWNEAGKESSWAFQGFLDWFWAIVPHPPAWIETGLAYYFWDVGQVPDWRFGTHRVFADDVLAIWGDKGPDLTKLLGATFPPGEEKQAWAFVTFLMTTDDPAYARAFGGILADLSDPTGNQADAKSNAERALARLTAIKPLSQIAQDCLAWWKKHPGVATLVHNGEEFLKTQDGKDAKPLFDEALKLAPDDGRILYLAGLASYESNDYPTAEAAYLKAQATWKDAPAGLLDYALGLNFYQTKNWTEARKRLETAAKNAADPYSALVKPLLANLP